MVEDRSAYLFSSFLLLFLFIVSFSTGCSDQEGENSADFNEHSRRCLGCHQVELDPAHQFDCAKCHLPTTDWNGHPDDHEAVLAAPAHPNTGLEVCGSCHAAEVEMVAANDHYNLSSHIVQVTEAFGLQTKLTETPLPANLSSHPAPATEQQLIEDLLVRRCLRCHVYSKGDDFSGVTHGLGCAACHLSFTDGRMSSHQFSGHPNDERCLSCHYANHVGYDYYGRYEHDLNEEYRTPYFADNTNVRPYGVEYHNLDPDVHQLAGMICIDCHRSGSVMGYESNPACLDCHFVNRESIAPDTLQLDGDQVLFVSPSTSEKHLVPQLKHPAHERYATRFSCQACHAQWTYNDVPTHLLRIDHEEFDDFYKLSLDGSSEVLHIVSSHVLEDGDLLEPTMSDKFSGDILPGIWFRGFGERRWEQVLLGEDEEGVVTTVRPILDLRLSYIDYDEIGQFDNLEPVPGTVRTLPYAAHTIGKAGVFYEARIRPFLGNTEND